MSFRAAAILVLTLRQVYAAPVQCYKGCTDNGGIPTGDYLDNACQIETCASTDTHCYSIYSNFLIHTNTLNPVTGAMDTTRSASDDADGRNYALGCVDATKKAALDVHYAKIFPDQSGSPGYSEDHCPGDLCNACQITSTGADSLDIASATRCHYGSFANDWKTCDEIYCMEKDAKCMSIKFNGQWGGTWRSGMGCQKDDAAATATCDEWKYHKKFAECESACVGDLCNVCASSAMQTSPSAVAMVLMALGLSVASYLSSSLSF